MTEQYRSDRRAAISAAAARCFATKGVHRTSMTDIIAESGLSAGAIYNHFRSKQEIVVSVGANLIKGRLMAAVDELDADDQVAGPDRIIGVALAELEESWVADGPRAGSLIIQVWAEAVADEKIKGLMQEQIQTIRTGFLGPVERWARREHGLGAAQAASWAEEISQLLIAMTTGYIVQRALFPDFEPKKYIADAEKMISRITPYG